MITRNDPSWELFEVNESGERVYVSTLSDGSVLVSDLESEADRYASLDDFLDGRNRIETVPLRE